MLNFLVHQCLFCRQTFDSAADKDDHILEHFAKETCAECNENLIRIGGHLYVRHDDATCIKQVEILEEHVESCMEIETVQTTPKPLNLMNDELGNSKNSKALDAENTPQTQTEPKVLESSELFSSLKEQHD